MKAENLLFSLTVLAIAICSLAALGWMASFMVASDLTTVDGSTPEEFHLFRSRVFIGLMLIGLVSGVNRLWDMFVFCMKESPTK
jgi:hypothetical protein